MYNLRTVILFEVIRTLKKKTFWIAALSFPVIIGLVGAVIFFSNKSTDAQTQQLSKERFSIGVTDNSGLIKRDILSKLKVVQMLSIEQGIQAVRAGRLDAYFVYPKDITKQPVEIYAKEVGVFKNSRYQTTAKSIAQQSAGQEVSPAVRKVISGQLQFTSVTYNTNGSIDKGVLKLFLPGVFLILFYFMIATFGNQILTSITEEKENRVIEMILTTIKPTTLLVGKLASLFLLAIIQMLIVLIPIIIGYIALHSQLALPGVDISQLPVDPLRISLATIIFFVGFLMLTSLIMTLGAAMPTAKEAGGFFGAILALIFGPLYAAPLFVSDPGSPLVQVLSYFPLTSPIPLLIRNAVGNLSVTEAALAITVLLIATTIIISIGVRIFRYGALEYNRRLSLKEIFNRS